MHLKFIKTFCVVHTKNVFIESGKTQSNTMMNFCILLPTTNNNNNNIDGWALIHDCFTQQRLNAQCNIEIRLWISDLTLEVAVWIWRLMHRDKLRCSGSWNECSLWVRGAETCMIKSCLIVFLINRHEPHRFTCLLFWNCYYWCLLFWNPCESPVHLGDVWFHPRRMEGNLWTCDPVAPAESQGLRRRRCEGPHRGAPSTVREVVNTKA